MYFHYYSDVAKVLSICVHFCIVVVVYGFGDAPVSPTSSQFCKTTIEPTSNMANTFKTSFFESILKYIKANAIASTGAISPETGPTDLFSSVLAIGENSQSLANFLSQNHIRTTCYNTLRNPKAEGQKQYKTRNQKIPIVADMIDSINAALHPQQSQNQSPQKPSEQAPTPAQTCQMFNTAFRLDLPQHDWIIAMTDCITKEFLRTIQLSSKFGVLFITSQGNVLEGNFSQIEKRFLKAGFRKESYEEKVKCQSGKDTNPLNCPHVTVFRKINK